MVIHVVRPGDSLYAIGRMYGVSPYKIASDNELTDANVLVVGQALVIMDGTRTHTVQPGQSLYTIAMMYGTTINAIQAANPQITNPSLLQVGQIITIPSGSGKLGTIEVNGYAFPNIDKEVLAKTLPYLTYISIFSYEVNPDGTLRTINDESVISAARSAGVAPLMVITNLKSGGGFSSDVAASILRSPQIQDKLLDNILNVIKEKNYTGLDIDFEYIYPQDRENYNNFLRKTVAKLRPLGYTITSALAPKLSADQPGLLYEAHDYPVHGELLDHVILMTYEWGYTSGPPLPVAPINEVRRVLNYAVTAIPRKKILMGIPNYGYDWTLPYKPGTRARTLSNTGAVDQAARVRAAIQFDQIAQTPFYYYYDENRVQHVVWFEDARSIQAKLMLVNQYSLGGVSYWTIGRFFPQNWLVLKSMYDIRKVL